MGRQVDAQFLCIVVMLALVMAWGISMLPRVAAILVIAGGLVLTEVVDALTIRLRVVAPPRAPLSGEVT